jgi:hypothetical protein
MGSSRPPPPTALSESAEGAVRTLVHGMQSLSLGAHMGAVAQGCQAFLIANASSTMHAFVALGGQRVTWLMSVLGAREPVNTDAGRTVTMLEEGIAIGFFFVGEDDRAEMRVALFTMDMFDTEATASEGLLSAWKDSEGHRISFEEFKSTLARFSHELGVVMGPSAMPKIMIGVAMDRLPIPLGRTTRGGSA